MNSGLILQGHHAKYTPFQFFDGAQNLYRLCSCGSAFKGFSMTRIHHSFLM
jgi:hypothetical protein